MKKDGHGNGIGVGIYERAFQFTVRILRMDRARPGSSRESQRDESTPERLVGIGSNLEEARGAQSRADFHAKVRISLKEARESHYWLRLLRDSECIRPTRINPLLQEAHEIVAILTTIAKKTNPRSPTRPAPSIVS